MVEIPLSELHSFKGHPFKVKDDDAMMETADSIRQYGVLVPAIARPDPSGGYELVAGHRRHRASELAEKETMPVSAKKVELASVDDLFSTEESRADAGREKVVEIPLSELHSFKGHPFKVKDDDAMMETADSIRQYGVLVPAIARPDPSGGYELVAGHRRHRASELAEKETMPVIVRDLDDDAATIIMVDSNLQRESLLPSERAFAYKMKLEAMKHQGERMDLTSAQVGRKSAGKESREILAEQVGQSRNQISRYIRLTELIPELLNMVDEKKIALNPAYELSFLKKEEQTQLLDAMDSEQATPSLSQAQRLKKFSQEGHLSIDVMRAIMGEEKKSDLDKVTFTSDTLRKYFPKSYTPARMQETIIKLLEQWQKKRQRDQER
ncbi:ParB/RepB/Spo0J family partition protein [Schaedlerella arabinosiphila]|uniref:ParB/RepB/Spo0J family partition protein n=1 Tax=Schaedlerella arabinosiphila TaxID=2044587 RepID=UPI0027E40DE8|nr:ParB/RepB/Spo0J family partition protein [Schaedlerella arabinosiphila]